MKTDNATTIWLGQDEGIFWKYRGGMYRIS